MTSKTTESKATELRQAIAEAKGGRRNGHVPSELRRRALELLDAGRARGTKARETASALGVHETTLLNWQRERGSPTAFVQAQVVAHGERERAVVQPSPARTVRVTVIDGLDAATLEAVLRGLS
jgi:hypothetical protein